VIKELQTHLMPDSEASKIMIEIELLNKLKDDQPEFVVQYFDAFINGTCVNIIFEFCEQGDLASLISSRNAISPGFISEKSILKYFIHMTLGVDSLHKNNILHRDLKSLNVFLSSGGKAKIGDLGSAVDVKNKVEAFKHTYEDSKDKENPEELVKSFTRVVGTPYYIAPEIWLGSCFSDKSDIWSLGVILFELITLKRPF
jgi:NIMA (never in mitosis gene a)-related kinase 1/4/5